MTDARYVRLALFCEKTGWTEKAIRRKMENGVWLEGQHYRRAPDGAILIDMKGYEKWVEGGKEAA